MSDFHDEPIGPAESPRAPTIAPLAYRASSNGRGDDARSLVVENPYDQQAIAEIGCTKPEELIAFLDGATKGPEEYRDYSPALQALRSTICKHSKSVATLMSKESGLALQDTRHELERCLGVLDAARAYTPTFLASVRDHRSSSDVRYEITKEPIGPVLAITPSNHPLGQVLHKLIPAVVANTPIILKPSEKVPLTAQWLFEQLFACGIPERLIHLHITDAPAQLLSLVLRDSRVRMIAFTGGYDAGRFVARSIAESPIPFIRQAYELGGSSSLVVTSDANLPHAVDVAMQIFRNSGQRCTMARKILVDRSVEADFVGLLRARVASLVVGDPLDPSTQVGTLIDEVAADTVYRRVEDAIDDGARLVIGHRVRGAQYWPTIVQNVDPRHPLVAEETFGPVASVIAIDDLEEAIRITRDNRYGLAGAIVTSREDQAREFYRRTEVGQFNWNGAPGYRDEAAPFGGFRDSGNYTKEGVCHAAEGYTKLRTIYSHACP